MDPAAKFGSCCNDLNRAMSIPPQSLFRVSEEGVLYLTVGYSQTDEGIGWFDQAVIFCPFCGEHLQTKEEILKKTSSPTALDPEPGNRPIN